jgi:caffeoyl-CoA O-methyltransferase
MWYLVIRRDAHPRQAWTATLDEHLAWMKLQHESGTVMFSGPSADIRTGIYVIRARSLEHARHIAAEDPFTKAGHCTFECLEWDVRQVLGTGPFSVAELDALKKAWREAWEDSPSQSAKPAEIPRASRDWTAGRMCFQLEAEMERYVVAHSESYGSSGKALVDETAALGEPAVMMIAKEQYALLRGLTELLGCKHALDIGTFTGLSALAFAEGVGPGGQVTTIDRNPAWVEIAQKHWASAGVRERIDVQIGEASDRLHELAANPEARFDIAFLDVDKARTREYFEQTLNLMAPGGLMLVDNALWHGWVLDDAHTDADTEGMRRFNEEVANDSRVKAVLLPIADGMWLIRRRHPASHG